MTLVTVLVKAFLFLIESMQPNFCHCEIWLDVSMQLVIMMKWVSNNTYNTTEYGANVQGIQSKVKMVWQILLADEQKSLSSKPYLIIQEHFKA